ncbi:uncharacterized protein LOC132308408 isoform X2 [Cornus florida]|uniref:uncharacterized protein LOC132308408 isoform X2 n=1 Tax=Cornus florida TaxID=4283 RepID=UPI00289B2A07|nr:uncharacterized protein LOC132308408 isoform X2 [Cornus florida]
MFGFWLFGNFTFLRKRPFFLSVFQPPTEKLHQIIARTATFVSKHGGQSEIVLRVKQGDNPTFGFLMPDHHLHAYFRFLVDNQELLQSDIDGKLQNEKADTEHNQTDDAGGGALSLLGSVYGYGEDEDGGEEGQKSKENISGETFDAVSVAVSHGSDETNFSANAAGKDESASKLQLHSKEKLFALTKNSFISAPKAGTTCTTKKGDILGSLCAAIDKSQASAIPTIPKVEQLVLEPSADLKRLIDKIVEFILKNGKRFEAVLMEQDSEHGRFPFLLPSNKYHPYYLKVLQKAQESKLTSLFSKNDDLVAHGPDRKTSQSEESDSLPSGSGFDVPYDSDRKEKFKMVIGKPKKDGQDPPSKATQQQFGVQIDAASAAAILQAATKGIRYPNLGILSSTYGEGGRVSSSGSQLLPRPECVVEKSDQNGDHSFSAPVTRDIAKTASLEAVCEADSSEANLNREQKLKAERLKRAKMFAAMWKTGAEPLKTLPLRGISVEPQESGVSGSGAEVVNLEIKEREGSSVPLDVDAEDKIEKPERKYSDDEYNERRLKRKYRMRSQRDDDDDDVEDEDEEGNDEKRSVKKHRSHHSSHKDYKKEVFEKEIDHKHSRKKHRSHHSSCEDEEERDHKQSRKKHRSDRYSCEEEEEMDLDYSRKKQPSYRSSHEEADREEEEEIDGKHSRKKHRSHRSSHHSRDRHKHRRRHSSSKEIESRQRHKHDSSSDDEQRQKRSGSNKHKNKSLSDKEELEEGEISSKISDNGAIREGSLDSSNSCRTVRVPSQPSEATEVSDDLRAKIRAMLMATL